MSRFDQKQQIVVKRRIKGFRGMAGAATMRELLDEAAQRAMRYLAELPTRHVAPTDEAIAALAQFDTPLPREPQAQAESLRQLD